MENEKLSKKDYLVIIIQLLFIFLLISILLMGVGLLSKEMYDSLFYVIGNILSLICAFLMLVFLFYYLIIINRDD